MTPQHYDKAACGTITIAFSPPKKMRLLATVSVYTGTALILCVSGFYF